jgi:hypothetical protein
MSSKIEEARSKKIIPTAIVRKNDTTQPTQRCTTNISKGNNRQPTNTFVHLKQNNHTKSQSEQNQGLRTQQNTKFKNVENEGGP